MSPFKLKDLLVVIGTWDWPLHITNAGVQTTINLDGAWLRRPWTYEMRHEDIPDIKRCREACEDESVPHFTRALFLMLRFGRMPFDVLSLHGFQTDVPLEKGYAAALRACARVGLEVETASSRR